MTITSKALPAVSGAASATTATATSLMELPWSEVGIAFAISAVTGFMIQSALIIDHQVSVRTALRAVISGGVAGSIVMLFALGTGWQFTTIAAACGLMGVLGSAGLTLIVNYSKRLAGVEALTKPKEKEKPTPEPESEVPPPPPKKAPRKSTKKSE